MIGVTFVCVGKMKEAFFADAFSEYRKRLGAYCRFSLVEIPEQRLPADPPREGLHNGARVQKLAAHCPEDSGPCLPSVHW